MLGCMTSDKSNNRTHIPKSIFNWIKLLNSAQPQAKPKQAKLGWDGPNFSCHVFNILTFLFEQLNNLLDQSKSNQTW